MYDLAEAITKAFGFYFDHCFGYYDNKDIYQSGRGYELFFDIGEEPPLHRFKGVENTIVQQLWKQPGDTWHFHLDYGDDWLFTITLTKIVEKKRGRTYPLLLESIGENPEQYPSYEDEEIIDDEEEHEEDKEMVIH